MVFETYGLYTFGNLVFRQMLEDMRKILTGMLEPEILHIDLGRFKVKQVFWTGKKDMVVGGSINKGRLIKKCKVKVFRDDEEIGIGEIDGLKLVNEDVEELEQGTDCGVHFLGKIKLKEDDVLEAWTQEKKMKTL